MPICVLEKLTAEWFLKTIEYSCWYASAFSLVGIYNFPAFRVLNMHNILRATPFF